MAAKLKFYCDGNPCEYTSSDCNHEITEYDAERCIAFCGENLSFQQWTDAKAEKPGAILFHKRSCAVNYLRQWLKAQQEKPVEYPDDESTLEVQL